jgi:siroheme decarboxylase
LVRALQEDLALEERPFLRLADGLGIPEGSVFAWMEAARDLGWMRRFAAVLRHREAGFGEGGMGVWAAPEPSLEGLGQAFATEAAVTHCYQRPVFEGWPYGLFTMVHGRDRRDCEAMLDAMAGRHHGWTARAVLYSTHEYKKERVKYFLEEQGPRHLPVEAQERPC